MIGNLVLVLLAAGLFSLGVYGLFYPEKWADDIYKSRRRRRASVAPTPVADFRPSAALIRIWSAGALLAALSIIVYLAARYVFGLDWGSGR